MPGAQEFSEVIYLLTDIVVASYNSVTDTFGTPVSLAEGQSFMIEPEGDTDKLRGYGVNKEGLSVPIGAVVTLGQGTIDRDALVVLAGVSSYLSGLTPNRVVTMDYKAGGDGELPYFGAIGVAKATNGGLVAVGVQKVMLDTQPKWTLDGKKNAFVLQETKGYAFPVTRSSELMLIRTKTYETASNWTAPTDAASFKAFFTSPAVS